MTKYKIHGKFGKEQSTQLKENESQKKNYNNYKRLDLYSEEGRQFVKLADNMSQYDQDCLWRLQNLIESGAQIQLWK